MSNKLWSDYFGATNAGDFSYKNDLYPVNDVKIGYSYYVAMLTEKCLGQYNYSNLPENLPEEQIELRLIQNGYCCIFKAKGYQDGKIADLGLVTAFGGLSGVDMYYKPTRFVYAQPVLVGKTVTLHKDCAIIYNSTIDEYRRVGFWEIIRRYARMLADLDSSFNILTVNGRAGKLNVVADEQTARTVNEAFQKLALGEYQTINQKSIIELYKTLDWNGDKTGQMTELLMAKEKVMENFLQEIGVNKRTDKRERLVADEVYADDQLLTVNTDDMLASRKKGVEEINRLFGTNITVRRNEAYEQHEPEEEGSDSDESEDVSTDKQDSN